MTRKDYILLADVIKRTRQNVKSLPQAEFYPAFENILLNNLENALAGDNYRFDTDRFEEYINKPE